MKEYSAELTSEGKNTQ